VGHEAGIFFPLTILQNGLDHRALMQAAMRSKSQQIREALVPGDQIGALRIAARFFDRSPTTKIYSVASTPTIILTSNAHGE
jgi:hypothetical protein